jgi:FixJ family two-component response regulator
MPNTNATVHVVDDDESFRTATIRLLTAAGYRVNGYTSAGDFLMALPFDEPGCILLDVRMPGPSGIELQQSLSKRAQNMPIVFLTGHGDIPMSVRAMKSGAVDFLTKPVQRDVLLSAIDTALEVCDSNRKHLQNEADVKNRYHSLTTREKSVFLLVVRGKLNKQIAAELGVSERTVKAHRAQVMSKMQVDSLAALVRIASQVDLGDSPPDLIA